MQLSDLKNKKATVMGIGLHGGGVGVIKFLVAQGVSVLATDLRNENELKESLDFLKDLPVQFVLGEHRSEDFVNTDMVIKNPAVPANSKFLKIAREKNIPIENEIGIFFELCPAPIIGITGTKGKSTTAALLAQILQEKFSQVILAGRTRSSALEKLHEITKDSIVILELSSLQLADAQEHKISPQIAVITNILPDHQNYYKRFEDYISDKKLIFEFQKAKNFLFLNFSDPLLKKFSEEAKSKIYFYGSNGNQLLNAELPKTRQEARLGAYLKGDFVYFGTNREKICSLSEIKLLGQHNLQNALAAISVAKLCDASNQSIKKALHKFKGLPGRIELIAEIKGVKYINDTAATCPDATIAAIDTLSELPLRRKNINRKYIVLIAGGSDKKLDFTNLGKKVGEQCKTVILLPGDATAKLKKSLSAETTFNYACDMPKAISLANSFVKPGDMVLLSPGCASFGLFRHEFERGKAFCDAVASLKIYD